MKYEVAIKSLASGEVIRTIGPCSSEREAERVLRGVLINMSDNYCAFVREIDASKQEPKP